MIGFFLLCFSFASLHQAQSSECPAAITITFSMVQQAHVYEQSAFGDPPQLGIWLENQDTEEIHTVYVTEKVGKGNFEGKAAVPVALPAWIVAYRSEVGSEGFPTAREPVADAVTGATSRDSLIEHQFVVDEGSRWSYFIEVNVAGDYNHAFPSFHEDGYPDPDGNGQPSLVYGGEIVAKESEVSEPVLLGRTEQLFFSPTINQNVNSITTAKQLLGSLRVTCSVGKP